QQQLHERNHYDHGKRDTVALELDELLHQHGPRLAPKTSAGKALRRLGRQQVRHQKLSLRLSHCRLSHSSSRHDLTNGTPPMSHSMTKLAAGSVLRMVFSRAEAVLFGLRSNASCAAHVCFRGFSVQRIGHTSHFCLW